MTRTSAPKPTILAPDVTMIPAELRDLRSWLAWRQDWRHEQWSKVPVNPLTGRLAKTDDPSTWADISTALRRMRAGCDGIGLCRTGDYLFIDLDGCFNGHGRLRPFPWVSKILDAVCSGAYVEKSVSGTGIHAIVRGTLLPGGRQFDEPGLNHTGFAFYDANRYFTFTGRRLRGSGAIEDLSAELTKLHGELFPRKPSLHGSNGNSHHVTRPIGLNDAELIERAFRAKNGSKFARLWSGRWEEDYPSQNEADLALCCHLAFWCGKDPVRMDSLFRQSGLYREKWEREDYRNNTIAKAIEVTSNVYNPEKRSRR